MLSVVVLFYVLMLVCGNAKDRLGWVRGPGRHGGGAVAMCGRPLMSALNFWSFCFKTKGQDNRSHRCPSSQARHGCWSHTKKISNRTDPNHPKGLGKVRFISVRERSSKEQSLTEPIRGIRRVWVKFGSFRLETEDPKNNL